MKLEHFLYLKTIAETNSISLASERLFITQQALSKSIKGFESELGITLFNRTNQGIILTQDGEYVLQIANQMLSLTHELEHYLHAKTPEQISGTLNIMLPPSIHDQFTAKCISNFYRYYPLIQVNFLLNDEIAILSALSKKEIDLGFMWNIIVDGTPILNIDKSLKLEPISKYRYSALVSKKSPLAKLNSISLQTLAENPIILRTVNHLENSINYHLMKSFGTTKFYPVANTSLFYQLIADDIGVSLSPNTPLISNFNPLGCVTIPIENNFYNIFGYVYNKENNSNPCIEPFLDEFFHS